MKNATDAPACGECGTRLELRCPCARAECRLVTPVPFCPACDKQKLDKWETAHGIKVCDVYMKAQLGL